MRYTQDVWCTENPHLPISLLVRSSWVYFISSFAGETDLSPTFRGRPPFFAHADFCSLEYFLSRAFPPREPRETAAGFLGMVGSVFFDVLFVAVVSNLFF